MYIDAALHGDPARCMAIDAPQLRGECLAMAARDQARAGALEDALQTCATMPDGDPWRDECHFLTSDAVEATGEQARDICARAGRFTDRCLGHALGRDGRALLHAAAPGTEREVYRQLREQAQRYFDSDRDAGRKLWHILVEFVASRDGAQPFSAATCGTLPQNICRSAFLSRMRFATRDAGVSEEVLYQRCDSLPVTAAQATEAGLPTWTPDAESIARGAWKMLCAGRPQRPGPGPSQVPPPR